MPLVRQRGLTFHVQSLGAAGSSGGLRPSSGQARRASPVVMLHGLLVGSMTTWYFGAAPRLAETHRVLLYDLRGHGKSERPATGYGLGEMAADLDALLELHFGAEPAILVGHSWGALTALRFALRRPERVARLVLVEAPLPPSQLAELAAFVRLPPAQMAEALPEPLRSALERGGRAATSLARQLVGLAAETTALKDLAAEADIPDDALARLAAPTLLVYGDRSSCRPTGDRLVRVLPHARLSILKGGHFLPTDAGPALTSALVEELDG
jgi:pimeloyl-ACP methyl ester carboxylesterase